MSIAFSKFFELFFKTFFKRVDFPELPWYYLGKKGVKTLYTPRQETISIRIKKALKIKGMKQAELCKLANIPKSSLSQYLSGDFEPKQDRIYLIAKALNVSEAWLMGFDVPMDRQAKMDSPEEPKLTEGEKMLLDLFRRIPEDQQALVLNMIRVALGNQQ